MKRVRLLGEEELLLAQPLIGSGCGLVMLTTRARKHPPRVSPRDPRMPVDV